MSIRRITSDKPTHPALEAHHRKRRASLQNRIADAITRFAGSMVFVYVHIAWFSLWIGLRVEKFPYGLLTMMVSLEAIFLSTFLLISQNRQDEARSHLANMEWHLVQQQTKELGGTLRVFGWPHALRRLRACHPHCCKITHCHLARTATLPDRSRKRR